MNQNQDLEKMTLKELKELIKKGDKKLLVQILEYLVEDKKQLFYIKRLLNMFNINLEV
jgi:hypothetical protein